MGESWVGFANPDLTANLDFNNFKLLYLFIQRSINLNEKQKPKMLRDVVKAILSAFDIEADWKKKYSLKIFFNVMTKLFRDLLRINFAIA